MMILKHAALAAGLSLPLLLTGCQTSPADSHGHSRSVATHTETSVITPVSTRRVSAQANGGLYLQQQRILVGEQLQLDDTPLAINSEFIDRRGELIATLDEHNRLVIVDHHNRQSYFSSPLPFAVETLCLYQPGNLQAFIFDEDHKAHQLLIRLENNQLQLTNIRQFSAPPNTKYCVSHDQSDTLYVAEENIGVWAYNARAESEVVRSPVALVAPYGRLQKNSGPLAISNNLLWLAEAGTNRLHSVPLADIQQPLRSYQLISADSDQAVEIDTLSVSAQPSSAQQQNQNRLLVLNDANGELLAASIEQQADAVADPRIISVAASGETEPVTTPGDAADDPAIWLHPQQAEKSRILATNKQYGLHVYNLAGQTLQTLVSGRVNNVDVRQGFSYQQAPADIATASQRDNNTIALYHIDPASGVVSAAGEISTTLDEVYGLCMGRGHNQEVFVFINDEDGRFEQYQIIDSEIGWSGQRVREFSVASQPEGCVSDDRQQRLFLGEENRAIWTLDLSRPDSELQRIQSLTDQAINHLHADIEGMDIYQDDDHSYLVVSSQGNDSYVLFDSQPPHAYRGHFRVAMNTAVSPVIDGASETDGLAVTSARLNEHYPEGLLVVQDGRNLMPAEQQNFKLVSWKNIRQALALP